MRHKFLLLVDLALTQISFFMCARLLSLPFDPTGAPLTFAVVTSLFAYIVGMYGIAIRYAGVSLLRSATIGAACGFTALVGVYGLEAIGFFAFASLTSTCGIICARVAAREYMHSSRHASAANTLVYGAGDAGVQFVTAAMQGDSFKVLGFIDDDPKRTGSSIHGVPVSASQDLAQLIETLRIKSVVLALPSLTRGERKAVIERIMEFPVRVVTVPTLKDIIDGSSDITDTQDVPVEDLLGRDPVPPNRDLLEKNIKNKSILVTGAGGSIGSELCRQIAALKPEKLILLDNSEPALFKIEQTVIGSTDIELISILCSVNDPLALDTLFKQHRVDTVFHAAAYKHVPMVEANPLAAVKNNVYGTKTILEKALEHGCSSFTLVSTDKAVRPTNIMGATKRIAEMLCQAVAKQQPATTISMVRFGNVLGSSGSVIPTFRRQIRSGGPVTLTHPDITRFFMTIPEAAQLVIQSSALANGGEVFLLDMGEPIKIYDLAKRLIRLSGKTVADVGSGKQPGSIEISVTGLRPGEKLYEELLIDAAAKSTAHPKIMTANEPMQPYDQLLSAVEELKDSFERRNVPRARNILVELGTGYHEA